MKTTTRKILFLFIVLLSQISEGQVCDVVINVCSNELISSNPNDEDDFPDLVGTCVTIDGARSVWYKIKIESGSELTFDITPSDLSLDYDFVVYGGLDGIVEHIGADTVMDEEGNPFYEVLVRTDEVGIAEDKPIIPGMTVEVDILTGKKTILEYLMKPILRAKQYSLSER